MFHSNLMILLGVRLSVPLYAFSMEFLQVNSLINLKITLLFVHFYLSHWPYKSAFSKSTMAYKYAKAKKRGTIDSSHKYITRENENYLTIAVHL